MAKESIYGTQIIVRMTEKMKQDIHEKAKEIGQTDSDYIRSLIIKDMNG